LYKVTQGADMVKYFKRIYYRMIDKREKRASIAMLESFSDKDLQDLGIGRSEIYSKVHGIE
jgi:uncharacterized protein YjiS (DUF1127 family)